MMTRDTQLIMFRALTILLFFLAVPSLARAQDWTPFEVSDHLRGGIGSGVIATGWMGEGKKGRLARLKVYCADNSTAINLDSENTYFGSSDLTVTYTIDGGAVRSMTWETCQGGKCVGMWHGAGIGFLKSLYDKKELRLVLNLRYLEPLNATFGIAGAKDGLEPVAKKCGWQ